MREANRDCVTVHPWDEVLSSIDKAIANETMLAIAPEERLYLVCECRPEDKRFAAAFRKVWKAIPEADLSLIRLFLKKHASFGRPQLEYSNLWSPHERVYATAAAFRAEIQFVANEIDPMRFKAVCFLIAHELAHFFQKARGDMPAMGEDGRAAAFITADGGRRTIAENEADADQIAERWGFPRVWFELDIMRLHFAALDE